MTATYRHTIRGDLARVRLHHGLENDYEARRFLVDRAVSALWDYLKEGRRPGSYRLAVPFGELRFYGKPLVRLATGLRA